MRGLSGRGRRDHPAGSTAARWRGVGHTGLTRGSRRREHACAAHRGVRPPVPRYVGQGPGAQTALAPQPGGVPGGCRQSRRVGGGNPAHHPGRDPGRDDVHRHAGGHLHPVQPDADARARLRGARGIPGRLRGLRRERRPRLGRPGRHRPCHGTVGPRATRVGTARSHALVLHQGKWRARVSLASGGGGTDGPRERSGSAHRR